MLCYNAIISIVGNCTYRKKKGFCFKTRVKNALAGSSFIDRSSRSVRGLRVGGVRDMVVCARARLSPPSPNVSKRYETGESVFPPERFSTSPAKSPEFKMYIGL